MKKITTLAVVAFSMFADSAGAQSDLQINQLLASARTANPGFTKHTPVVIKPVVPVCPSCVLGITQVNSGLWNINVGGEIDINYFESNSIVLLEHPILKIYASSWALIDSFKLSEETVDYRESWRRGHEVSGSGSVTTSPSRATITWEQTDARGNTTEHTEEIPLR